MGYLTSGKEQRKPIFLTETVQTTGMKDFMLAAVLFLFLFSCEGSIWTVEVVDGFGVKM